MSILNCTRFKSMVVETIDDTVIITKKGPDIYEVRIHGFDDIEYCTAEEVEVMFRDTEG